MTLSPHHQNDHRSFKKRISSLFSWSGRWLPNIPLIFMTLLTTTLAVWGTWELHSSRIAYSAVVTLQQLTSDNSADLHDQALLHPTIESSAVYQYSGTLWQRSAIAGPIAPLTLDLNHNDFILRDYPLISHVKLITATLEETPTPTKLVLFISFEQAKQSALYVLILSLVLWLAVLTIANGFFNKLFLNLLKELPLSSTRSETSFRHLPSPYNRLKQALADTTDEFNGLKRRIYQLYTQVDLQDYSLKESQVVQKELEQARREATEAHLAQSTFLASVSHELRTPLHSIIGYADLLLNSNVKREHIEPIETIQMAGDNLLALVNNILDYTKLVSGNLALYNEVFYLPNLIDSSLALLGPQLGYKAVECIPLIYDDVPLSLIGDPLRMRQILLNLVGNAIKHTDQGDIVIRVMLENIENNHAQLRFTIVDNGHGLGDANIAKLFEAFHQAGHNKREGAGLGLAISKRLVEVMGGEIGGNNNEFGGATFWFTLKLQISPTDAGPVPLSEPRHVVIIEPHDRLRLVISRYLKRIGYTVDAFATWPLQMVQCDGIICGLSLYADEGEIHHHLSYLNSIDTPAIWLCNHGQVPILKMEDNTRPQLIKPIIQTRLHDMIGYEIDCANLEENDTASIKDIRLLAVDDHPANLKLLKHLIEEMGYSCSTATNGAEAVEAAKEQPFALILMDMKMPVMDGLTATKTIRAMDDQNHSTPIVILTAHAMADEQEHLINEGATSYTMKPITKQQLEALIKLWVKTPKSKPVDNEADTETSAETNNKRQEYLSAPAMAFKWVDWNKGLALANQDSHLARDMLIMFVDSLKIDSANMKSHWAKRDYSQLIDTVHRIHGASRYCGVPMVSDKLKQVESLLKRHEYDPLPLLCEELFTMFAEVTQEVRDMQNNSKQPTSYSHHSMKEV